MSDERRSCETCRYFFFSECDLIINNMVIKAVNGGKDCPEWVDSLINTEELKGDE